MYQVNRVIVLVMMVFSCVCYGAKKKKKVEKPNDLKIFLVQKKQFYDKQNILFLLNQYDFTSRVGDVLETGSKEKREALETFISRGVMPADEYSQIIIEDWFKNEKIKLNPAVQRYNSQSLDN